MTYIRLIERRIRQRLVRVVQFHEFYYNRTRLGNGPTSEEKHLPLPKTKVLK